MKPPLTVRNAGEMLQREASEVETWLRSAVAGEAEVPPSFNWHGFAEGAAQNALSSEAPGDAGVDLTWARIAAMAYQHLIDPSQPDTRDAFTLSLMMLRASLISRVGGAPGDSLLDADDLIRWFHDSLPMSLQEAEEKARRWQECSLDEIRKLRRIKNSLGVLAVLASTGRVRFDAETERWLRLRDELP